MIYRREIDGLRAIAVVPVVLFHAGIDVVSGGFLGVDVFFVISGYLITSILIDDLEKDRFSILRFYERRVRRILPALIAVLLFSLACACIWIFPRELMYFSRSLLSVLFFYSNIQFFNNTGYFSPEAEVQPLLHTWSLAVEEQFYLVFPLLLALVWRFGRKGAIYVISALGLKGAPWRFSGETARILSAQNDKSANEASCMRYAAEFRDAAQSHYPLTDCVFPKGHDQIDVAIVGDSHASALSGAVSADLTRDGLTTAVLTVAGCAPWVGITKCETSTKLINKALMDRDIQIVVLAARYSMTVDGSPFVNGVGGAEKKPVETVEFSNAICTERTADCRQKNAFHSFRTELDLLVNAGKTVILVYPVPEGGWHVPKAYARLRSTGGPKVLSYPYPAYEDRYGAVIKFLDSLDLHSLYRVKPAQIFCQQMQPGSCVQAKGDEVYYFDDDHLSNAGARLVSEQIMSIVRALDIEKPQ
ncbi:Acyltransferase family protein [Cohaesibacter sp. ES.047]|uniref:acyltransferase family protein n=1 Tax=Cohaesibacter sp. ES.047 TaxID=1798205 RepID=UPI000BB96679|nr:acyltransferase family protein [Cohaesibacter sp. ES.047]SNY90113.1 Acyltransferase family protein [Cohaesibacter sp. ES.047]